MSRTRIAALAALLVALGGPLVPPAAHATAPAATTAQVTAPAALAAAAPAPTITPSTATNGDEMTVFRGTGSGFTPNASIAVTVTVNGGPYRGTYTKTRSTDGAGALSWAWIWTAGDPYGSYTLTFSDPSGAQAGVGLTIANGERPPATTDGSDLMVDMASAPPLSTVQAWQREAPYDAIAVYLPVDPASDNRHDKDQANLDAEWVRTVQSGGWQVVPIYVGLQAPKTCQTGSFHAMSTDPTVAQAQGEAAAGAAVGAANTLGIDAGLPVVYDMESYRAGCRAAVQAFLVGWTARLHALGRPSGVYGGATSAAADLAAAVGNPAYVLPDLFWAATDNRRAATEVDHLPASGWAVGNQFLLGAHRSYGADETLEVDESAIDHAAWSLASRLRPPDATAPIVAAGGVPRLVRDARVGFSWSAVDGAAGLASYQLRTRRTPGGHRAGAWRAPTTLAAVAHGATTLRLRRGEQVCVQVRAEDAVGNVSDWTLPTCTSRLADDRAAKPGRGWHRRHHHAAYRHTLTTASSAHAVLRLGHATAGRLGVVHRGRGTVVVRVGGHRVGTLRGSGTTWVKLPRGGKVTLTTTTSRRMAVDGFVLVPREGPARGGGRS